MIAASPEGSPATIRVESRMVSASSSPVIRACPAWSICVVTLAKVPTLAHSSSLAVILGAVTAPSPSWTLPTEPGTRTRPAINR